MTQSPHVGIAQYPRRALRRHVVSLAHRAGHRQPGSAAPFSAAHVHRAAAPADAHRRPDGAGDLLVCDAARRALPGDGAAGAALGDSGGDQLRAGDSAALRAENVSPDLEMGNAV